MKSNGYPRAHVIQRYIFRLSILACLTAIFIAPPSRVFALDYFDDATNNQIIEIYIDMDDKCRGGAGDLTMAWCGARDLLGAYMMEKRNLCYGKKGQSGVDMRWHKCTSDSIR